MFYLLKKLLKYIKNSQLKIRLIQMSSVSIYGAGKYNFGKKKLYMKIV